MTTTRKHFAYKQNATSFVVKTQLTPSQRKLLKSRRGFLALGKQLPNVRDLNLLLVTWKHYCFCMLSRNQWTAICFRLFAMIQTCRYLFKYVLSTMGVSKESISKFLIENRFHVKLRILSPYSNRIIQINCSPYSNKFYLNKDWGCVILREIDFLLKICWSIPCLHPSWIVHASRQ